MTAKVTVIRSRPGMGDNILHELSDGRFSIWETTRRPRHRGERFEVIEHGAGVRGNARTRGYAPTLEAALGLAATLEPSTPAEILAPVRTHPWADDGDQAQVDELVRLAEPGARLWVLPRYGESGPGYAATSEGLFCDPLLSLAGDRDLECWMIRWRGDNGREDHGRFVVLLEDARRAWWIIRDGRIVAGGPPIYDPARAAELAVQFDGHAQLGLGAADPTASSPVPAQASPSDADAGPGGSQAAADDPGVGRRAPAAVPAVVARHESEPDPPQACECGCGRPVPESRSGPPRRYATNACRAAVYRRRLSGAPLDLPRQPNRHGRRGLAAMQRT